MPTTAITTALAANAAVQSSIAASQAHEANVRSCLTFVDNYDSHNASVRDMKEYSSCVEMLHPSEDYEISVPGKLIVGSLMFILLLSIIIALVNKLRSPRGFHDGLDWFEVLFLAPSLGAAFWAVCWATYAGLIYLFS